MEAMLKQKKGGALKGQCMINFSEVYPNPLVAAHSSATEIISHVGSAPQETFNIFGAQSWNKTLSLRPKNRGPRAGEGERGPGLKPKDKEGQ